MDKQIYRSGNEIVEAIQYIGTPESFDAIYDFTDGKLYVNGDDQVALHINDNMIVVLSDGDYVVKDGVDSLYVYSEKWFASEFQPIAQDDGSVYNYLLDLQDYYGSLCEQEDADLRRQGKFELINNMLWRFKTGKFKSLI